MYTNNFEMFHGHSPRQFFDDEQTLTAVREQDYVAIRHNNPLKPPPKSQKEAAIAKLESLEQEFAEEFDVMKQLSHMTFAEKFSVCYEAQLIEKNQVTKQIVRVVYEGGKPDTCSVNKKIRREQMKRSNRDERAQLYFPTLLSVDKESPCIVTVEERVIGQELLDVIQTCRFPIGKERLGYMGNLFIQMCHGIAFLHEHGYTHNDLAPDNILVESGLVRIKIIDFDSSVNVNNPANPHIVDADGTVLHDWFNMQLYHKEPYRAVECWKAYELVCTNRERRVYVNLKSADTFSLLMLFWEMLTGVQPPSHQLGGANALAQQIAASGQQGGEAELAEAFEQGFDLYFGDVIEELGRYPPDICGNLESLFDDIADITQEVVRLNDGGEGTKIRVKRDSVDDILNMDWLRRARTIIL